jgi:hypothetical protein
VSPGICQIQSRVYQFFFIGVLPPGAESASIFPQLLAKRMFVILDGEAEYSI